MNNKRERDGKVSETVIRPNIAPKDFEDAAISLGLVLPLQAVGLLFIPWGLTYLVSDSAMMGLLAAGIVNFIFLLFSVPSISLSADGIKFRRVLGSPRLLAWDEIIDITPASRKELIINGWLWPLFPAREMTASMSSLGHFRIRWSRGFCYYPPIDAATFEEHVANYLTIRNPEELK